MGGGVNFSPLVSVVIPVYNVEAYLDKCLQSVLNQTLHAIEVIAIDDASTDRSWEILQSYACKDARLVISRNEKNKGTPSYARNKGIIQAKGKYVAFIDSDDFVVATLLEKIFNGMEEYKADISYCDMFLFNDRLKLLTQKCTFSHINKEDGSLVFNYKNANEEFWINQNGNACFKMYNRSFLMQNKLFFDYFENEDLPFSIYGYILAKQVYYLKEPWYYYRRERQDGTKNRWKPGDYQQTKSGLEGLRHLYAKLMMKDLAYTTREEMLYKVYVYVIGYIRNYLTPDNTDFYDLSRKLIQNILQLGDISFKYFTEKQKMDVKKIARNNYKDYMEDIFNRYRMLNERYQALYAENEELRICTSVKGFLRYRVFSKISVEKYILYPKWLRYSFYVLFIFKLGFKKFFKKIFRK